MGINWISGDKEPYGANILVGAAISIAVIQILFVAARFYTRFMQKVKVGIDDYLILLALVCHIKRVDVVERC